MYQIVPKTLEGYYQVRKGYEYSASPFLNFLHRKLAALAEMASPQSVSSTLPMATLLLLRSSSPIAKARASKSAKSMTCSGVLWSSA